MNVFESRYTADTEMIGEESGKKLKQGDVVALFGDLGAGKTAFTRGVARGLGLDCDVSSPTFSIVNEYKNDSVKLYHFDMYRVLTWDSLYSTGFFDYLDTDAILIIEWSENIENVLPDDYIRVEIEKDSDDDNVRKITITGR